MSMAANSPSVAAAELAKASDLGARVSPGERLLIGSWRAWKEARLGDARSGYDQLCGMYAGEKRAFLRRGLFRQVALGDLEGAVADYKKAVALDEKYGAAQNFLGFALADQGKVDEAENALKKYATLAPTEPNALDSLATLALRMGDLGEAMAEERKALNLDPKFIVAHAVLGDAQLMSGKVKDARREYAFLEASDDPAVRHEGTMREARSFLFGDRSLDAERALVKEGAEARRAGRLAESAESFLDVARIQIERGALAEAGRGIKEATESLRRPAAAT
jgi:tetratricopeptide (TPR) repeat protein